MNIPVLVYDAFKDDEKKAHVLSEAFNNVVERLLAINEQTARKEEAVTKEHHDKSILELQYSIEKTRSDLSRDIEQVRGEFALKIEQVNSNLSVELEKLRGDLTLEIEKNRTEMKDIEVNLHTHINRMAVWIIGAMGVVIGAVKALDYLLK